MDAFCSSTESKLPLGFPITFNIHILAIAAHTRRICNIISSQQHQYWKQQYYVNTLTYLLTNGKSHDKLNPMQNGDNSMYNATRFNNTIYAWNFELSQISRNNNCVICTWYMVRGTLYLLHINGRDIFIKFYSASCLHTVLNQLF